MWVRAHAFMTPNQLSALYILYKYTNVVIKLFYMPYYRAGGPCSPSTILDDWRFIIRFKLIFLLSSEREQTTGKGIYAIE